MLGHHKRDPSTKIIKFEDKNRLQIPAGSHPMFRHSHDIVYYVTFNP